MPSENKPFLHEAVYDEVNPNHASCCGHWWSRSACPWRAAQRLHRMPHPNPTTPRKTRARTRPLRINRYPKRPGNDRQGPQGLIADKDLSMYAHNIKIITRNGTVTLKGPVKSDDEKQKVERCSRCRLTRQPGGPAYCQAVVHNRSERITPSQEIQTWQKHGSFGLYATPGLAENAVDHLLAAGFRNSDISVLLPDDESTRAFAHEKSTKAPEGTAAVRPPVE